MQELQNSVNKTGKAIDKAGSQSKNFGNSLSDTGGKAGGLGSVISSVTSGFGGFALGAAAAISAAKKIGEAVKDLTEAYKVQARAETQLEAAARNNPYLNNRAVSGLKDFASELQSISTYGDEALMPLMAQLAAAGRTEDEIRKIMSASVDIAASGVMSLDSAVTSLNKTFSGTAGLLGNQFSALKNLTQEELENGKAVDIMAENFRGMAEEVTKATGTSEQLANAFGDLKEELGAPFEKALAPMRQFFTNLISGWTDALKARRKYKEAVEAADAGTQTAEQEDLLVKKEEANLARLQKQADEAQKLIDGYTGKLKTSTKEFLNAYNDYQEAWGVEITPEEYIERYLKPYITALDEQKGKVEELKVKYEELKEAEDAEAEATQKQEAAKQKAAAIEARKKSADDYAIASNKKLKEEIAALELKAKVTGETVSVQDKYNVVLQSYMDLMTKTEGLIKEGYPVEQKRLEQLTELRQQLEEAATAQERLAKATEYTQAITATLDSIKTELTPAQSLNEQIAGYEKLKQSIAEYTDAEIAEAQKGQDVILTKQQLIEGLNEAEKISVKEKVNEIAPIELSVYEQRAQHMQEILELKKELDQEEILSEEEKIAAMKQLDDEYTQSQTEQFAGRMSEIKSYTDQACSIVQQACQLMLKAVQDQTKAELAELELKYRKGEMGEKEYEEAVLAAKRKGAQEEYKIKMFEWAASLAQATANIAEGVAKAIAQGGFMGILTGALVSAAGAVQIASIIASKPEPPNFSTGGFLLGNSTSGDKIPFKGNAGEAILNPAEMRNFMDYANGTASTDGLTIVINNSASNIVSAQPEISREKIEIMIDARVNESLKEGRYNQSLTMAEQSRSGEFYGI